ncbi:hypothetical protein P3X46_009707 [Hevea brasiliensis]|uniref:Methyltransferase type 11 domain-containing protein n=1 Tax=Hevea brasiliensis TaxID=3981 RepID=A0ABQ9MMP6_HEVBR|nr:uncharacterized protein LOC110665894 [Hevea brasiliensis]KAJ9181592.1 hypothetical protein P3X46_009707 [Hevea brasiliensis]
MDFKSLRIQILSGSIARRLLLRAFMLASAFSVIPFIQILSGSDPVLLDSVNFHECDSLFAGTNLFQNRFLKPIWSSFECKEDVNLTMDVVTALMVKQLLDYGSNALYVGEGSASAVYALRELGFSNACGVHRHPFFSIKHRKLVYELQFADNFFDFVLSRDLDEVSVPAVLVLEIERVLKPGGIGAMLVGVGGLNPNGLIRSATPVSSLLKSSNVVHVGYVHEYTLVVFQKRFEKVGFFEQFRLPADCQSFSNNKHFMEHLEPLVENKEMGFEKKIAFLPNFIHVLSRKKLVYIEIGAAERLNSSVANWFIPFYPVDHKAFDIYFVDHNTSVLLSCVKKPGVTFIYYPGLAGDKITASISDVEDLDPSVEDEGFDFLSWFRETVEYADFVVLKMKAGEAELKFLTDLYESGAICFVDELFLSCADHVDDNGVMSKDCMDLLKSLRSSGMYVHQWWGE